MQITRGPRGRFAQRLVVLIGLSLSVTEAQAQKLSIQGDRFAIDGTPRFLTFMTYFGAMGAPNVIADLHLIRNLGFDGIRIWPNLDTGPQLMNSDGTLRPDELTRLRSILDQARHERLVVDVSFTYEHIRGMDAARARLGIIAATDALRSYENLLFDIQNERNVGDRRFMSVANVASILAAIRATDPARIVTCSNSPVDDAQYAADFTGQLGLDVTAYHEPRSSTWYTLASYQSVVGRMKSNGRPAYLQEAMPTRDDLFFYPSHDRAEYFLQGIAHAKLAGAAAWCFHTDVGVDFRAGPPFVEDRLRSYPEPEWAFVNSLNARVILQASNGVNYVVAEGGGGGGVRADRTASGPGSWEVLGVSALSGGPLNVVACRRTGHWWMGNLRHRKTRRWRHPARRLNHAARQRHAVVHRGGWRRRRKRLREQHLSRSVGNIQDSVRYSAQLRMNASRSQAKAFNRPSRGTWI